MQSSVHCPTCNAIVAISIPEDESLQLASYVCEQCGGEFTMQSQELHGLAPDNVAPDIDPSSEAKHFETLELETLELETLELDTLELDESEYEDQPVYEDQPAKDDEPEGFAPIEESTESINEPPTPYAWDNISSAAIRPKRKEVSFLRKVIPPVLGGLAAFPIATAIMWYGLGKDLGSAGPFVSKYIPSIVPKHLRSSRSGGYDQSFRPTTPYAPENKTALPKLERNDSNAELTLGKPSVPANSEERVEVPAESKPDRSPDVGPSIKTQVGLLKSLQSDLYTVPKEQKLPMIVSYYQNMTKLAELAESLRGPTANVWRRELESLSREVLKDDSCKKVLQSGPLGKIPGLQAAKSGDYVATIVEIAEADVPDPSSIWLLSTPWARGKEKTLVQMMPGAWRNGTARPPTTCLVLGRLSLVEPSTDKPATDITSDSSLVEDSEQLRLLVFAALVP